MTSGACHRGGPPSWQSNSGVSLATRGAPCFPRKRGLGGTCADDACPVESRSADFVLDVGDAGRVDCPDLLELERPAVETRE